MTDELKYKEISGNGFEVSLGENRFAVSVFEAGPKDLATIEVGSQSAVGSRKEVARFLHAAAHLLDPEKRSIDESEKFPAKNYTSEDKKGDVVDRWDTV